MITFSKDLGSELLNAYNNNIIEFSSDNVLQAVKCSLTINNNIFEITPNPSGNFCFNFKEISKVITNENRFKDTVLPDIENSGYVYPDDTLYSLLEVDLEITFLGGSTETASRSYNFVKSLQQPEKYQAQSGDVYMLLPKINNIFQAVYQEGKPFDISIYSNINRTVTIKHIDTSMELDIDLTSGVNRLFFSQGSSNFTIEDDLPLFLGVNHLEFHFSGEYITMQLEKKDSNCGKTLKWFNSSGSYSYISFVNHHKETIRTRKIDSIYSDFNDISESYENDFLTGKTSALTYRLHLNDINQRQRTYFESLLESPRVDLYLENQFEKQLEDSWRGCILKDASFKLIDNRNKRFTLDLDIVVTRNTMVL